MDLLREKGRDWWSRGGGRSACKRIKFYELVKKNIDDSKACGNN